MATRPSVIGRVLLLSCAGALAILGIGGPQEPAKKVKGVTVGPKACDLDPPDAVHLSSKDGDQVRWAPKTHGQSLSIVFKRNAFPQGVDKPPFMKMKHRQDGDWEVADPSQPNSINAELPQAPGGGLHFKYDQILDGERCDGMIIIDP
jgi:hypothetical protein